MEEETVASTMDHGLLVELGKQLIRVGGQALRYPTNFRSKLVGTARQQEGDHVFQGRKGLEGRRDTLYNTGVHKKTISPKTYNIQRSWRFKETEGRFINDRRKIKSVNG
jgi:hypothetical protein